jgi:hypothetical protein
MNSSPRSWADARARYAGPQLVTKISIKAELEAKTKEFQAAVAAAGVKLGGNVAKMEVREAESAFA